MSSPSPIAVCNPLQFSRPTWAEIDLDAVRHNAAAIAKHVAPAQILAVIKANAYGHGAVEVATALRDNEALYGFAVASVDEALKLRDAGIDGRIMLLSAITPAEAEAVVRANLMVPIWEPIAARALAQASRRLGQNVKAHFKVDTGMGRLGISPALAQERWHELQRDFPEIQWAGIFTHLACADEEPDGYSAGQLARFQEFLGHIEPGLSIKRHAANSAGILRYPEAHLDMVRPGLALYGIDPCAGLGANLGLKPVMAWYAAVTSLKHVPAGGTVSYGATWAAPRDTQVATVSVGYADGYFRALSNRGKVMIAGVACPVVGRVTMDQISVDISAIPAPVNPGQKVTLMGPGISAAEIAQAAGTISWEVLCAVSARVPRLYLGHGSRKMEMDP